MTSIAIAIVAFELVSTVSAAVAQDASSHRRTLQRQQRKIAQQQQQLLMDRKLIEQQRRQLARARPTAGGEAPDTSSSGFGGLFQCPPHYYFSWLSRANPCLPDLDYYR